MASRAGWIEVRRLAPGLAAALLIALPLRVAGAGDGAASSGSGMETGGPIGEADPASPSDGLPSAGAAPCPSRGRCCVPGETLCWHPGAGRLALGLAGGLGFGLGTAGFLWLGDSLGSGDPYGGLIGSGGVALVGVGLGALVASLAPRPERTVPDRPSRPTLRLRFSPGGATTFDERSPGVLGISLDPTMRAGDLLEIQPQAAASFGLGPSVDVDPRPQVQQDGSGEDGTFAPIQERRSLSFSAGAELALSLPYPARVGRPLHTGRLEIRWRPRVEIRRTARRIGGGSAQIVEQFSLLPALLGVRWHVSPRQRFTVLAGPCLDGISWGEKGSIAHGRPFLGTFRVEAWYQLDVPLTPLSRGPWSVTGQFEIGYVHSMLDGQSVELGPIIGFLGPLEVAMHVRARRHDSPVALQVAAGVRLNRGGGPFVEIGLAAPDVHLGSGGSP